MMMLVEPLCERDQNAASRLGSNVIDVKHKLARHARPSSAHTLVEDDTENICAYGKPAIAAIAVEEDFVDMECGLIVAVAERVLQKLVDHDHENQITLFSISSWMHMLLSKAQCPPGTIIVAHIYCERLLQQNNLVHLTKDNWKSITLISILLASKVWDDLSMHNIDFCYLTPFSLLQVNDWERAFLRGLRYNVQVDSHVYESLFYELRARIREDEAILECEKRISHRALKDQPKDRDVENHYRKPDDTGISIGNDDSSWMTPSPSSSITTLTATPDSCLSDIL